MSFRSDARRVAQLTRREWGVVLRSTLALPSLALAVRLAKVSRVQRRLAADFGTARGDVGTDRIVRIVSAVTRRHPYRANCLERSLTLWWLLGRHGVDADLRFGVRPSAVDASPDFHAWVEVGGTPVNDRADIATEFIPFDRPIGPRSGRLV